MAYHESVVEISGRLTNLISRARFRIPLTITYLKAASVLSW